MKRLIQLLLFTCLATFALAQTKPDYQSTHTPQVLANWSGKFNKSLAIPSGPTPGFPAWVSDSSKRGSLFIKTGGTKDTLMYYNTTCGCWVAIAANDNVLHLTGYTGQQVAGQVVFNGGLSVTNTRSIALDDGSGNHWDWSSDYGPHGLMSVKAITSGGNGSLNWDGIAFKFGNLNLTSTWLEINSSGAYADHLFVASNPTSSTHAVNLGYLQGNYAPITGGAYVAKAGDTMTGDLILASATPTNALSAAPKAYIDNLVFGLSWKNSVRVRTTGNISLSGLQTIDSISVIAGNRILVNFQTDPRQNGIYIASASGWTRAPDADTGDEILGSAVYISAGTKNNRNTQWTCQNINSPTIGVDTISYTQIAGVGTYTNGPGINLSANVFSLNSAYARGLLSATGSGLNYNSSTGAFSLTSNTISGVSLGSNLFNHSAGTGLSGSAYNGSAAQSWAVNLSTGVSGGQSVIGDTAPSGSLSLTSTTDNTKGRINFGAHAYWDEASDVTGYPGIQVLNNSNLNEAALFFRRDLNNGSIYFSYNTAQTGGSGALIFGNPTNQAMYLNPQGYLAIGYALQPAYSLDIKPQYGNYTGSSALTTNGRGVNLDMQGSLFNTTSGALTSTGIYINNRGTRSTGSNGLTNRGLYVTASGAQNNYAAILDGSVGILTADPTHSLTLASVATGLMYWNSVDQVTNKEGLLFKPVSNVYTWDSQSGGTGTARGWAWAVNGTQKATIDINGLFTASSNIVTLGRFGVNVSNPASLTGWVNIGGTSAYTTSAAFGTAGFGLNIMPGIYNSQAAAGSPSAVGVHTFGVPSLTATNAQAITTAATVYIAGAPFASTNVTITSPYSLQIASGITKIAGLAFNPPTADKTANYSMAADDYIIPCNSTAGSFNVTLLSTAPNGVIYAIENVDGTANSVTIIGTINGVTNYTLNAGKSVTLYKTATGSNTWKILYNN